MKLNVRILLINFAIVILILGGATFTFYSIMFGVLTSQQSKHLLESANNFIYAHQADLQKTESDFKSLLISSQSELFINSKLENKKIDFIFTIDKDSIINRISHKEIVYLPSGRISISEFIRQNPFAVIFNYNHTDQAEYYYGRVIAGEYFNEMANKINSEIALVWNDSPVEMSNESVNLKYTYALSEAYKDLSSKNNFDIYTVETNSGDILATIFKPKVTALSGGNLNFIIFSTLHELAYLRDSLKNIVIILGLSGVALSLILTLIFTERFRKQIIELSKATEIIKQGNFKNKIDVRSKDELGQLAQAFNSMQDELEKNERAKNEYSEFITLINQNPTLKEIADAALRKIIKTTGLTVGALYSVENEKIQLTSSFGLKKEPAVDLGKIVLFESVITKKETIELNFKDNYPTVSTGLVTIELRHLIIIPIVYSGNVIAILELGGVEEPSVEAKEYLVKIQEQLAIGLSNATAFVKLRDLVAELKKLNEEYQKQNVQIRQQNETLLELHQALKEKAEELEVQKEKAEELTKLKSQFLASMSHELRTPMNSILGLTELILEDQTLQGKNRERISVVLRSGRRLMALINDILDLSKIEAGKMELRNEDVYLQDMINEVEAFVSPLVLNKDLEFEIVKKFSTEVYINTDRGRVIQVLINLLGNAIKFTERGFVRLIINQSNADELQFQVIDSGIGISEENQKIIFEEFRQVDGTSTRKYSGTGLGLAICKKIADLMGGNISVYSKPGEGSTFTFAVPLSIVEKERPKADVYVDAKTLRKNRKNPILVIDDDPEVRYTIGQYLNSKGYEVVFADNGESGIKEAVKIQPFAITLDVMLPNKDGWNVLKELKENPETKEIPVVLISILGDKKLGYGLGAFEYIVKPISSSKLTSVFQKLENLAQKRIEKIVIVDDDELEFEKFKNEFKNDKVRIEYIKDSELAFSKILETQPDLAIIDLIMPGVDGITLSHKLKSNKETKHIPIIISTAKDLSDEERESLNDIVENITVKSKGHPLDVLKVVRDSLQMQERSSGIKAEGAIKPGDSEISSIETNTNARQKTKNIRGKVLVVDDDPDTLFTIGEILDECECQAHLARSGSECLQLLAKYTPDIILLDIMMPEMDGFQTFSKIKEIKKWANIPILAISAKAMLEDKKIILKHGFDDFVPKPINAAELAFKLEKTLITLNVG